MKKLEKGLSHSVVIRVAPENTALYIGSGDLEVFASPAMLAAMENAAMMAVALALPEGSTTVGAEISSSHLKPSCVGSIITATALLTEVDGRRLTFEIEAADAEGLVGKGSHVRYIVDREKFMAKLKNATTNPTDEN